MSAGSIDFYVLGAQKCATTWLYQSLRAHADVWVSRHKGEERYVGGDWFEEVGWEGFLGEVGLGVEEKCVGDVSVNYLYDGRCAEALMRCSPEARFVLMLRHPVGRFISAYQWHFRKGEIDGSLGEVVARVLEGGDGLKGVELELFERGCYARQLVRYLEVFSSDQFLILNQEVELLDPVGCFRRVCRFLGVEVGDVPSVVMTRPKQFSGSRLLIALERCFPDSRYVSEGVNRLHQMLCRFGGGASGGLCGEDRDALQALYRQDMEGLVALLERLPVEQVSPMGSFERWLSV